ncbi:MAG: 6-carboxytetrahydropterin synthase QueD [Deltaproteobacteria bacterium]|nr:6-carboxytetrahydropterin synthase QueD [Deltaproteobacteria bacterium]
MSINSARKGWGVKVCVEFSAAHHIRGYDGECARPHGHNFKVEVEAAVPALNSIGIALDFKDLKKMTKALVDRFDHQDLNTVAPFTDVNPTAETLAHFFFEELERQIAGAPALAGLALQRVTIWENERSAATYGLV